MSLLNNRSNMVLFQNEMGHRSQKIRMVLSEKGIACDFESLDPENLPTEILEVNPSGSLPLLIDRELSLYHSGLILFSMYQCLIQILHHRQQVNELV